MLSEPTIKKKVFFLFFFCKYLIKSTVLIDLTLSSKNFIFIFFILFVKTLLFLILSTSEKKALFLSGFFFVIHQ